jgi:hypothetical protein
LAALERLGRAFPGRQIKISTLVETGFLQFELEDGSEKGGRKAIERDDGLRRDLLAGAVTGHSHHHNMLVSFAAGFRDHLAKQLASRAAESLELHLAGWRHFAHFMPKYGA